MAEQMLPGEDEDIALVLHKQLKKDQVKIHTSTTVIDLNADQKKAILENDGAIHDVEAEYVLVSIGRKPRIQCVRTRECRSGIFPG